jgi:hypothetical protein
VEERLRKGGGDYALDPLFGFLCTCPSMHGTAFTARVVFRVPTQRRETESLFAAARKADLRLTKACPRPRSRPRPRPRPRPRRGGAQLLPAHL